VATAVTTAAAAVAATIQDLGRITSAVVMDKADMGVAVTEDMASRAGMDMDRVDMEAMVTVETEAGTLEVDMEVVVVEEVGGDIRNEMG
jgi:hypothetical protein